MNHMNKKLEMADTLRIIADGLLEQEKPDHMLRGILVDAANLLDSCGPIGIKIEGDPYKEVADIVDKWCQQNYYSSALVTLSIDGRKTTELLSLNGYLMEFEWDNDWWEGEKDIVLLGFEMLDNIQFYGYPNITD